MPGIKLRLRYAAESIYGLVVAFGLYVLARLILRGISTLSLHFTPGPDFLLTVEVAIVCAFLLGVFIGIVMSLALSIYMAYCAISTDE